jgi:hypothetical protein
VLMASFLQFGVEATGYEMLQISADKIGTHSIQSGVAMAMYLNNIPIY